MQLLCRTVSLLLLATVWSASAKKSELALEDYLHKVKFDDHCASNGFLSSMPRFYLLTLLNTFHNILDTKRNEARFCDFFGKLCNPTGFTKENIAAAYERYKGTFTLDLNETIAIPDEVMEAFMRELSTKVVKGKVMTLGDLIFALEQDYKHTKTKLPKHGGKRLASIPVRKALLWLVVIEPLAKRHNIAKKTLNVRIQAILSKPFLKHFKLNRVILAALKNNADFKKACETDGPGIASGLTELLKALQLNIAPVVTAEDVENMQQHSFKFRDNYRIDSTSVAGLYETTSPFEPTAIEPHANIVACFVERFFRFQENPRVAVANYTSNNVLKWTLYHGVLLSTVDSQLNSDIDPYFLVTILKPPKPQKPQKPLPTTVQVGVTGVTGTFPRRIVGLPDDQDTITPCGTPCTTPCAISSETTPNQLSDLVSTANTTLPAPPTKASSTTCKWISLAALGTITFVFLSALLVYFLMPTKPTTPHSYANLNRPSDILPSPNALSAIIIILVLLLVLGVIALIFYCRHRSANRRKSQSPSVKPGRTGTGIGSSLPPSSVISSIVSSAAGSSFLPSKDLKHKHQSKQLRPSNSRSISFPATSAFPSRFASKKPPGMPQRPKGKGAKMTAANRKANKRVI